ncbi:zinc finger protein CONSTANS-LIKE 2-like isoform X2 [Punica granatum]|uniref:Zinc finger protein CONSTANS-LIKE 2-like isoform X2 n=1 Tax=Punica granatum TaxID=22663 RepID=A0A6P8EF24_PUNGR|nr:zinc finger protein CONSTANS-LIKE 2-like isoform X2 [Punica granatum]
MEQKKLCELCGRPARMYCESDEASLCWDCDETVHSANFLVAKHSRTLLCRVCQSPTPWAAAGPKLGPTVSVCDGCFDSHGKGPEAGHREGRGDIDNEGYSFNDDSSGDDDEREDGLEDGGESMDGDDDDDDGDDDEDEEEEEEEEEDGENQVVPWSCDSPLPPPASSSSSGEESTEAAAGGGFRSGPAKRVWDNVFSNDSDEEVGCTSSQVISRAFAATEEAPSSACYRPLKQQRVAEENPSLLAGDEFGLVESKPTSAIINSLKRLQKTAMSKDSSAAAVLDICRLSRC